MSDYKKIAEEALKKAKKDSSRKTLNENIVYPDGISERMHPRLEDELINRKHSLGKHPIFPEDDETTFEQRIMGERFNEVVKRYKRTFDVDSVDEQQVVGSMMKQVYETMGLEANHKKELEKLAEKMIREEFDMSEDIVEIHAELTPEVSLVGTKKNPKPVTLEMEFNNHEEMANLTQEVHKRRFLNAMTQGAAKKCNHMFHMVDEELTNLDPRLPNRYARMMSAADYMYYIIPDMHDENIGSVSGGVVRVQFPTESNPKAVIYAQAMVFPVLIHELIKGVMELMSAHGLPKDKNIGEYVINKADYLSAESWDMRIGPALWSQFTKMIDPEEFHLKHHIYSELAALPVNEFNTKMREIMAGTKEGKQIVKNIIDEVKAGFQEDDFNEAMNEVIKDEPNEDLDSFDINDLFGDDSDDETQDDGYDIDDLM